MPLSASIEALRIGTAAMLPVHATQSGRAGAGGVAAAARGAFDIV